MTVMTHRNVFLNCCVSDMFLTVFVQATQAHSAWPSVTPWVLAVSLSRCHSNLSPPGRIRPGGKIMAL